MLSSWHQLFATQAGVGAALTGLVFVALSINLKQILDVPGLAGRAAEALFLLVLPIFVGLAGVLPQTSVRALGIEILVIGIIQFAAVTAFVRSGYEASRGRPARE
jgi:modulator of FtsH protease